jgi:hypothetical protein
MRCNSHSSNKTPLACTSMRTASVQERRNGGGTVPSIYQWIQPTRIFEGTTFDSGRALHEVRVFFLFPQHTGFQEGSTLQVFFRSNL